MESLKKTTNKNISIVKGVDPSNANSLLIEELWESVLRAECPTEHANRLIQLKQFHFLKFYDY